MSIILVPVGTSVINNYVNKIFKNKDTTDNFNKVSEFSRDKYPENFKEFCDILWEKTKGKPSAEIQSLRILFDDLKKSIKERFKNIFKAGNEYEIVLLNSNTDSGRFAADANQELLYKLQLNYYKA